jgi:hypothetical protein
MKRVLLGSAAGMFTVAGAQAADLPVKAQPVEYVKVCSLYGAGFWYVPGTDTCIKVGGLVKTEFQYNATGGGAPLGAGNTGGHLDRVDTNMFGIRFRGQLSFDMREQTEYGTLRSYMDIGTTTESGASPFSGAATQANNATGGAMSITFSRAFLQFAGFTAGRIRSFFDLYFQGAYTGLNRFGGDTTGNGIGGIGYTWQLGGGVSASFSLEDGGYNSNGRNRTTTNLAANGVIGTPAATLGFPGSVTDVSGAQFLDPVINLRLDQQWGFVGASAALHNASGGYYGTLTTSGHPPDKFGWAATAAVVLTSPFGLQGDTLGTEGWFTRGASGYAGSGQGGGFGANVSYGGGNNLGVGWVSDGIYSPFGGNVELTTLWAFTGAYEHRWDPKWRTSIYGGAAGTIYDNTAKNMICNTNPLTTTGVTGLFQPLGFTGTGAFVGVANCNPNFSASQLGTRTAWNPVPNIDVWFDFTWIHLNTAFAGLANLSNSGARPGGIYNIQNQDAFIGYFRLQRSFLY